MSSYINRIMSKFNIQTVEVGRYRIISISMSIALNYSNGTE